MIKINYFNVFCICYFLLLKISVILTTISVGGHPSTIKDAPFLVQVYTYEYFSCGGTLISKRLVVTAAHCVEHMHPTDLTIKGGASKLYHIGKISNVTEIMIHPKYDRVIMDMDVAVLKLQTPIMGRFVIPAVLCNKKWRHGNLVQVYGWGFKNENDTYNPNQMLAVDLKVIARKKCQKKYFFRPITDSMFCAEAQGRATCNGDSGGPVIINNEFCGIVSWSKGCARKSYPDVYTSVFRVRKFIRNAMQK